MGQCQDNMTPKTTKGHKLLDKIRGKKQTDTKDTTEALVDKIADVDELLNKLIQVKSYDLGNEKGQEAQNEKSLAKLKVMNYHLEQFVHLMEEYGQ